MKQYLLDTHTLLWYYNASPKLSSKALAVINSSSTTCLLSVGSLWEIVIKVSINKLRLDLSLYELENALDKDNIQILDIDMDHLRILRNLLFHHRDPFDRLIIAQAKAENLTVITKDTEFQEYDIPVVWN